MTPQTQDVVAESTLVSEEPQVLRRQDPSLPDKTRRPPEKPQILAELIVEEVSIDGMCGVY